MLLKQAIERILIISKKKDNAVKKWQKVLTGIFLENVQMENKHEKMLIGYFEKPN